MDYSLDMKTSLEDVIFKTVTYTVERAPRPFITREEGGHIRIFPIDQNISCIHDLSPKQAIELIRLEMVVREAMIEGMNHQGVPVIWVNIEDLGNWAFKRNEKPIMHIHVFGRVASAKKQVWPEAPYLPDRSSGFYDGFEPLTDADMQVIGKLIEEKLQEEKFLDKNWILTGK